MEIKSYVGKDVLLLGKNEDGEERTALVKNCGTITVGQTTIELCHVVVPDGNKQAVWLPVVEKLDVLDMGAMKLPKEDGVMYIVPEALGVWYEKRADVVMMHDVVYECDDHVACRGLRRI